MSIESTRDRTADGNHYARLCTCEKSSLSVTPGGHENDLRFLYRCMNRAGVSAPCWGHRASFMNSPPLLSQAMKLVAATRKHNYAQFAADTFLETVDVPSSSPPKPRDASPEFITTVRMESPIPPDHDQAQDKRDEGETPYLRGF